MFSVQQAIADTQLDPYPFVDATGTRRELPHMKALSVLQLLRIMRNGEIVEVLTEVGADPVVIDQIGNWPGHVVDPWLRDWMQHSDVELPGGEPGKSPSSSESSTPTRARSKPTSRGAGTKSRRSASAS